MQRVTVGALLVVVSVVWGCGDATPPESAIPASVGGSLALGTPMADARILQDQTTYQPVAYEPVKDLPRAGGGGSARSADGGGGETPSDPAIVAIQETVRGVGETIVGLLREGKYEQVVAMIEPSQVEGITADTYETFYPTNEKMNLFKQRMSEQFGPLASQAVDVFYNKFTYNPTIDVLDLNNATYAPSPLQLLFGPDSDQSMSLRKDGDGWRIQLGTPIDQVRIVAVLAHHQQLQAFLDDAIAKLEAGEFELQQFQAAVGVLLGQRG